MLIYKVSLLGMKGDVWCAINATRITEHIFFLRQHIHTNMTYTFWHHLMNITNNSIPCLESDFCGSIIGTGQWLSCLPDLKPCDQFFTCREWSRIRCLVIIFILNMFWQKRIQDVASSISQDIILKLHSSCNEKKKMFMIDVICACKPKEAISSKFFNYGE